MAAAMEVNMKFYTQREAEERACGRKAEKKFELEQEEEHAAQKNSADHMHGMENMNIDEEKE